MALYARAGFDLHPALGVSATLRHPVKAPDGVRVGGPADLERAAAVDRAGRGASRTEDLAFLLGEPGNVLLVDGDRGYAVAMADRLVTLGALDGGSAVRLLRAALARADPGAAVEVGWVTAAQQWAIGELAACHLDLRFQGAVMVRGRAGPPVHHLPSGGYG